MPHPKDKDSDAFNAHSWRIPPPWVEMIILCTEDVQEAQNDVNVLRSLRQIECRYRAHPRLAVPRAWGCSASKRQRGFSLELHPPSTTPRRRALRSAGRGPRAPGHIC